jgi:hypothetical protein
MRPFTYIVTDEGGRAIFDSHRQKGGKEDLVDVTGSPLNCRVLQRGSDYWSMGNREELAPRRPITGRESSRGVDTTL